MENSSIKKVKKVISPKEMPSEPSINGEEKPSHRPELIPIKDRKSVV